MLEQSVTMALMCNIEGVCLISLCVWWWVRGVIHCVFAWESSGCSRFFPQPMQLVPPNYLLCASVCHLMDWRPICGVPQCHERSWIRFRGGYGR